MGVPECHGMKSWPTVAVMGLVTAAEVSANSGGGHAIGVGSIELNRRAGVCAVVSDSRQRGWRRQPVAGDRARACRVGIDVLAGCIGKNSSRWKTPYRSILVKAPVSCAILLISQINETTRGAYQFRVDATIILYFIPIYMFARRSSCIPRRNGAQTQRCVLIREASRRYGSSPETA